MGTDRCCLAGDARERGSKRSSPCLACSLLPYERRVDIEILEARRFRYTIIVTHVILHTFAQIETIPWSPFIRQKGVSLLV